MERAFAEASTQLSRLHGVLQQLENARDSAEADLIQDTIQTGVRGLEESHSRLMELLNREPAARRMTFRQKLDQLRSDTSAVGYAVSAIRNRQNQRWKAAADREQLLTQRFHANDTAILMSNEEAELMMNDRLHSSNRGVDSLLAQGGAVLDQLRDQHLNLKGVRTKVFSVGQQLGLSNTTLLMIERRVKEDWLIFGAGCILTLIFMYCFYRYWTG